MMTMRFSRLRRIVAATRLLTVLLLALAAAWPTVAAAAPDRPVVFIPGILGSRLVEASGRVVWGERNSLLNYGELELKPGEPTPLKADKLVSAINVLGPFWTVHQYDGLLERFHTLGYVEGQTLFVFPYDWRQSNFDSAEKLATFIDGIPALRGRKFDLVAHSMGGLVSKIWMLEHGGAARVNKAIFLGTPFQGSMNALATLSNGWGTFANAMAGGLDAVRRVTLSFPGLIELLPSYERCCRLGNEGQNTPLDMLEPATWTSRDWLPEEYRNGARGEAFAQNLVRARRLGLLMRRELSGVQEVKFAGDVIRTNLWLYVARDRQGWKDWRFASSRGDGTVPVWSAANNFETTAGTNPSFVEHATIFSDQWVGNKLARELVSDAPPPVNFNTFSTIVARTRTKELSLVSVELDPPLATPGAATTILVKLGFNEQVARGDVLPVAQLASTPIALAETTTAADESVRRLTFRGTFNAPTEENTHEIEVKLPGPGTRTTYLTVLAPNRERRP